MSELKAHRFWDLDEIQADAIVGSLYYLKSEADVVIAELKNEIHNLKRSLPVARHAVAKARGKTSSYKSKKKLKEARRFCMEMYRDSWKNCGLSR